MTTESRLIIDPPAPGARNMAVDEALLVDAAQNGAAALRFYQWSEPTLSLGYFQHYEDRYQHEPSRGCAIVRRQTGGGAILHDRELTYSLCVPAGQPLARQPEKLYAAVHDAFIAAIQSVLASDTPCWTLSRRHQKSNLVATDEPFLCFQRRASGDVLLATNSDEGDAALHSEIVPRATWKILGSAQRRHRGAVLQHGSLLLEKSPAAPELPGLFDLTGVKLELHQIAAAVSVRIAAALDVPLFDAQFPPDLESTAVDLANTKYGGPGWTNRR